MFVLVNLDGENPVPQQVSKVLISCKMFKSSTGSSALQNIGPNTIGNNFSKNQSCKEYF